MARNTRAHINLAAIRHNYQLAKQLAADSRAVAIIKADAYGHGAVAVGKSLDDTVDAFGVAAIEEAIELREAGISSPILLLEGFFTSDELALIDRFQLDTVVHESWQVDALAKAQLSRPLAAWLKIDTGMHRLGFAPQHTTAIHAQLANAQSVREVILMTHFARADETEAHVTNDQINAFQRATGTLKAQRSLANSPGILAWPQAHAEWVRPGVMLYGGSPFGGPQANADLLKPAMTLSSEIIALRDLQVGDTIGYGGRYKCVQPTRVGVVAIGYGDGYPRSATDGTPVAVAGQHTTLIGRVSMDMITVDCTELDNVAIGSPVELWGDTVSVNDVARMSDTISYELLTRRPGRAQRFYSDAD
jgi:alanine racemase